MLSQWKLNWRHFASSGKKTYPTLPFESPPAWQPKRNGSRPRQSKSTARSKTKCCNSNCTWHHCNIS
ncbi:hypothetical protein PPTG_17278 [Phytophthora nicotianae INRA-310]|uniref:Uncharacterized protein n=1 Tax=Phytophthora nicotianae (strain INRA-310) TaxID=761204 RepID=W2PJB6_PHYN3|nr:hypothetical protein PPTG_17278 [Phytophthora nicotianae INRA-310]ETN00952.1 hypothetical protein PPTG_17278 [Phytophthora nicotianae INRA-310]